MPSPKKQTSLIGDNNTRWFIWTIVVLIASGTLLATYIAVSNSGAEDYAQFPTTKNTRNR